MVGGCALRRICIISGVTVGARLSTAWVIVARLGKSSSKIGCLMVVGEKKASPKRARQAAVRQCRSGLESRSPLFGLLLLVELVRRLRCCCFRSLRAWTRIPLGTTRTRRHLLCTDETLLLALRRRCCCSESALMLHRVGCTQEGGLLPAHRAVRASEGREGEERSKGMVDNP